jgi:uncharacterized membrane protein YraQ (UPF0718 family)
MNQIVRSIEPVDLLRRLRFVGADRVVLALLGALTVLALLDPDQATRSVGFTLRALLGIAPFYLVAIVFAGYAKASGMDGFIARAFSGSPVVTVLAASLMGALSPFCSCGVIPLIAAMLAAGVPLAPVLAFCISSPIMDPEMFILTAAGIGPNFALAKTVATIGMGLLAGFSVLGLQRAGLLLEPLRESSPCCANSCSTRSFNPAAKVSVQWAFWHDPGRRETFGAELAGNGWFLGKWLTLAFFLESLMIAYIPAGWIAAAVGGDAWYAVPLAGAVGVPAYLNGYAAIPLVAGLLDMGMSAGAAMAFVVAGAVSSIPAALAVYALVRRSVFALYLMLGLTGAVLSGYLYQFSGGVI